MNYTYTARGTTRLSVDKILKQSSYSSLQEYIDSKIADDIALLKRNPNKKLN